MVKSSTIRCSTQQNLKFMVKTKKTAAQSATRSTKSASVNSQSTPTDIHRQLSGMAMYEGETFFMFVPDNSVTGRMKPLRSRRGVAQRLSDGTFEFILRPKPKPTAKLIRKLPHGRLSQTKDGDFLLTLRFSQEAMVSIPDAMVIDSAIARASLLGWLREMELGRENQSEERGS